MDILRIKKSQLPAPPPPSNPKKRKERKVTSAAAVNDPEPRDGNSTTPEAGPSSGPGTLSSSNQQETPEDVDINSKFHVSS